MTTPTEFFRWWITDERTGKRRLTRYAMTREEAAERFPEGADADLRTREVRHLDPPGRLVEPEPRQKEKNYLPLRNLSAQPATAALYNLANS
jgi:hypothetical protein